MSKKVNARQSLSAGFTLVEIAVAMIIIGLLLGGLLKGQELVSSARATSYAGAASFNKSSYDWE